MLRNLSSLPAHMDEAANLLHGRLELPREYVLKDPGLSAGTGIVADEGTSSCSSESSRKRGAMPTLGSRSCSIAKGMGLFLGGFLCCLALLHVTARPAASPMVAKECFVELPLGTVRGVVEQMAGADEPALGRSFYGLPFGKAGRFEAPRPTEAWRPRVLDATRPGPSCARPDATGSVEDCLFLNVFTSMEVGEGRELARPVLVWLHGGSYTMGSASDTTARNALQLQLTNRLVVVSVEYRLGVLGFLGSRRLQRPWPHGGEGDPGTTGNWGVLDQQLALQWIHQYIHNFGGDPERVTLTGWSAGAASVSVHLSMPSSEGLFSRAVMLSGGFTQWAAFYLADAEATYEAVLKFTGCDSSPDCHTDGDPCRCLLNLDASDLVKVNPGGYWAPTVDGAVLKMLPSMASREGAVHKGVPMIIGSAMEDSHVDIGAAATEQDFRKYLSKEATFYNLSERTADAAQKLYMPAALLLASRQNSTWRAKWSPAYWAVRRMSADQDQACTARRVATSWLSRTSAPAYWYIWDVDYPDSANKAPKLGRGKHKSLHIRSCGPCPGAGHGSDLDYLFQQKNVSTRPKAEWLTAVYPGLLANFAYGSDPNKWNGMHIFDDGPLRAVVWPSAESGTAMYFREDRAQAVANLKSSECDFWDALA